MKNKKIFIIGGGTSIEDIDLSLLKDENTLAVNKSAFYVPNVTSFITMDYSFLNKVSKIDFKELDAYKIFILNTVPNYIRNINESYIDTRTDNAYDLSPFNLTIKSDTYRYFGTSFQNFASGKNSGFCAIQYALACGYDEIYLLGFDYACKDNLTHHHGGYGQNSRIFQFKLDEYFTYLREAIEAYDGEAKFYSCSKDARVNQLMPYKDLKEIL